MKWMALCNCTLAIAAASVFIFAESGWKLLGIACMMGVISSYKSDGVQASQNDITKKETT